MEADPNIKLVNGFYLPKTERHMSEALEKNGSYQEKHRKYALSFVRKWRNAIDIGAHCGLWACDLAEQFNKIIAFEPVEAHRNCLSLNLNSRGYDNYEVYPYCLGNEEKWVTLIDDPNSTGDVAIDPLKKDGTHEVKLLDSFKFNDIDFIKIDVEGFELYVLQGAKETILKCRPIINIEQKRHAENFGLKRYAACDFLKSLGMKELGKCVDDHVFGFTK